MWLPSANQYWLITSVLSAVSPTPGIWPSSMYLMYFQENELLSYLGFGSMFLDITWEFIILSYRIFVPVLQRVKTSFLSLLIKHTWFFDLANDIVLHFSMENKSYMAKPLRGQVRLFTIFRTPFYILLTHGTVCTFEYSCSISYLLHMY